MKTKKQGNYFEVWLEPNSMLKVLLGSSKQISLEVTVEADGQMIINCSNPNKISLIKGAGIIEKIEDKTEILQPTISFLQCLSKKIKFTHPGDTLKLIPKSNILNDVIEIAKALRVKRDSCREPYRQ